MAGNSSTRLPTEALGDVLYDEDIGSSTKAVANKVHGGGLGVDGGPVTTSLPLGTRSYDGINPTYAADVAAGDAESNSTILTRQAARLFSFNGSTWDRVRSGVTAIGTTFTGFLNTLGQARYNSTRTTRTDGQGAFLETNVRGDLTLGSMRAVTTTISTVLPANGLVVHTGACTFYSVALYQNSGGVGFIQLFDATTTVTNGTVPFFTLLPSLADNQELAYQYNNTVMGVPFTNGLVLALSTTQASFTATGGTGAFGNIVHYL